MFCNIIVHRVWLWSFLIISIMCLIWALKCFQKFWKIQRAHIYYLEPVVKFADHLEFISCGNFSEFAFLHFWLLFNLLILLGILNLAKSYWLLLELPGQVCPFKLEVGSPFSSSPLVLSSVTLLSFHVIDISCEAS